MRLHPASEPLLVVHQMAKVGSMAWVEAGKSAHRQPIHCHFLAPANVSAIEAILRSPADKNTLLNPLLARESVRKAHRAAPLVEAARRQGRAIQVVTGMREPVARSLSLLSFFADFCGHRAGGLSARDGAEPAAVRAFLVGLWEAVLAGREPEGSFERLLWRMISAWRTWFDEELAEVFGIDILATSYPRGAGPAIIEGRTARVFAYRAEDMAAEALANPALRGAAAAFLGVSEIDLRSVNTAETRRSWPLYSIVRDRFRLPGDWLDEIYASRSVRHFYATAEIEAFKARWSAA